MKNPFFISRPFRVEDQSSNEPKSLLSQTGNNTGNLLFISSLKKVLNHDTYSCGMKFNPAEIREKHDCLVIPAANWLNNSSDWGGLADIIVASKLPCVVVGLGAQSASFDVKPSLTQGTQKLIKVISERSHSLSVRGEYSAEVLSSYGIKNISVTGCPSLLWNVSRPAFVYKEEKQISRISINATRGDLIKQLDNKRTRDRISLFLTRFAKEKSYDFVAQTEYADLAFLFDSFTDEDQKKELGELLIKAYDDPDLSSVKKYIKKHVKVFFDADNWLEYMRKNDFAVGTRLHGVIAGYLVGVPGLLIVHDTRTQEMASYLKIPHVKASTILSRGEMDVQSLYDETEFSQFNKRMLAYYDEFADFFDANSLSHKLVRQGEAAVE